MSEERARARSVRDDAYLAETRHAHHGGRERPTAEGQPRRRWDDLSARSLGRIGQSAIVQHICICTFAIILKVCLHIAIDKRLRLDIIKNACK